ncbi:hypothetical protein [Halomicronema sp. CCY15110]|uniref:hypothetical protein n=1 Tax=Halomicronema sp. CCY15110 TaxID=2767773 RepID=UPI0019521B6C|nr:hypothetical protein [Halomicronema sp. CCY15110]
MRQPQRHNLLFRAACEGLKLLAYGMAGFISVCLFWALFGTVEQTEAMVRVVMPVFLRLTVGLMSLFAIAGLIESL